MLLLFDTCILIIYIYIYVVAPPPSPNAKVCQQNTCMCHEMFILKQHLFGDNLELMWGDLKIVRRDEYSIEEHLEPKLGSVKTSYGHKHHTHTHTATHPDQKLVDKHYVAVCKLSVL